MDEIVIRAENLGKLYRIGEKGQYYRTLRDSITRAFINSLKNLAQGLKSKRDKEYIWALKNVSFEIKRGEIVGIIGRNGAGKSTLLKILSRITPPTEGFAEVSGRIGSLLEVGIGFHPELSGRDNIYLNGAILGMKKRQIHKKFDEIVSFAEVTKFIDTPMKRYSSGMYVRLAFAVAAHLESEILLVDEVLAVGDVAFQKKCLGKMGEVVKEGRTILFVSHNMGAIMQLCDRAMVIKEGSIVIDSTAAQAINEYLGSVDIGAGLIYEKERAASEDVFIRSARIASPQEGFLNFAEGLTIEALCYSKHTSTVALEVIIRDQSGYPIIFLPSGLRFGREFTIPEGTDKKISCTIAHLPLAEGKYYVDLYLAKSGYSILDRNERCLAFRVISSDPCGTKRSFRQDSGQGCVHVDAVFSE